MDKNFTSLISDESTIFSDKWQQYLIERKNVKLASCKSPIFLLIIVISPFCF